MSVSKISSSQGVSSSWAYSSRVANPPRYLGTGYPPGSPAATCVEKRERERRRERASDYSNLGESASVWVCIRARAGEWHEGVE